MWIFGTETKKLDQQVDFFKRRSMETWFLLHNLGLQLVGKLPILLEVKSSLVYIKGRWLAGLLCYFISKVTMANC